MHNTERCIEVRLFLFDKLEFEAFQSLPLEGKVSRQSRDG